MESISMTNAATAGVPGPNKRVFAFLVDSVIYEVAFALLTLLLPQLGGLGVVKHLPRAVYFLLRDVIGPSFGKRLTSLTIVGGEGRPPGAASLILRNLPIVIPLVIVAEYFVMRQSSEGRRWGDRWANTCVQDMRPEVADGRFLWYSIGLAVVLLLVQGLANRLAGEQAL